MGIKKTLAILIGIFTVSFSLGVIRLASVPSGFYVDEAAIGYNAWSVVKTGRDEYGKSFPVFLKSWNSYTPALALYPIGALLFFVGPDIWSLRIATVIWTALISVAGAIVVYRLMPIPRRVHLVLAGLLFSLCPALVLFGRGFYEAIFGLLLLLLGISKIQKNEVFGVFLLSLATYAYHSERVIVYLLMSFVIGKLLLSRSFKILTIALIIFFITQIPQLYLTFLSSGSAQNIAGKSWISEIGSPGHGLGWATEKFLANFSAYYSPMNIFSKPDPDLQRSLPELSMFYPWLVVPYLTGLFWALRNYRNKWYWWLLLVFPVPAALTRDPFSTLRGIQIILPIVFLLTVGVEVFLKRNKYLSVLFVGLMVLSLGQLYRSMFVLLPYERFSAWTGGYMQAFTKADSYNVPVLVDSDKPVYILYLFQNSIDPVSVQRLHLQAQNYYLQVPWTDYYSDNKFRFARIVWREDVYREQLIISSPLAISEEQAEEHFLSREFEIRNPMGEVELVGYQTHPDLKLASLNTE